MERMLDAYSINIQAARIRQEVASQVRNPGLPERSHSSACAVHLASRYEGKLEP